MAQAAGPANIPPRREGNLTGRTLRQVFREAGAANPNDTARVFGPARHSDYWTPESLASKSAREDLKRSGILGVEAHNYGQTVDPTAMLPKRPSAQRAELLALLWGDSDSYYDPDRSYRNLAESYGGVAVEPTTKKRRTEPAPITVIPTSSTNPMRPRTVAAGFFVDNPDVLTGTLTVVFRDGTFYNYYDIDVSLWEEFKAAPSKGKFIAAQLDGTRGAMSFPRGPADVAGVDARVKAVLYRYATTGQRYSMIVHGGPYSLQRGWKNQGRTAQDRQTRTAKRYDRPSYATKRYVRRS